MTASPSRSKFDSDLIFCAVVAGAKADLLAFRSLVFSATCTAGVGGEVAEAAAADAAVVADPLRGDKSGG